MYKLKEINEKYRLVKPSSKVAELGCAPGSWSQYLGGLVHSGDQIIGVDLLCMEPVKNVKFIRGDFTEPEIIELIHEWSGENLLDLVLSDMAPNITGISTIDQARALELQERIVRFCDQSLKKGGHLLTKLFEGEGVKKMRSQLSTRFSQVQMIKPQASRSESKEVFLLGRGFKGPE